jgi:hypothetical protein
MRYPNPMGLDAGCPFTPSHLGHDCAAHTTRTHHNPKGQRPNPITA